MSRVTTYKRLVPGALILILASVFFLAGCGTTMFHADFSGNPVGDKPLTAQKTGTVETDGPAGAVLVVGPAADRPGNWVRVTRFRGQQGSVSAMRGVFKELGGQGKYTITATLFIPEGAGVVSIQCEPYSQSPTEYYNFLHIDFMENGRIRIDDKPDTEFGSFPRGKLFIVQVVLAIEGSSLTADISLSGDGASGTRRYTNERHPLAGQFGAIRLWMGFNWTGEFQATNIVVKKK